LTTGTAANPPRENKKKNKKTNAEVEIEGG
jgi:hypothetical protein